VAVVALDVRADWWSRAACLSADPDLFFPFSLTGQRQIADAKAVCADCQIRTQCLSYALAAGRLHGIWGGTTDEERRQLRQACA
jgi:WhiB family redox-sensing transcriptional regulator